MWFIYNCKLRSISSKKYWKVKTLVPILKGVISKNFILMKLLQQSKQKKKD